MISYDLPSGYLTEPWKITILIGKPSINEPLSMAMLVITRGYFLKMIKLLSSYPLANRNSEFSHEKR